MSTSKTYEHLRNEIARPLLARGRIVWNSATQSNNWASDSSKHGFSYEINATVLFDQIHFVATVWKQCSLPAPSIIFDLFPSFRCVFSTGGVSPLGSPHRMKPVVSPKAL